MDRFILAGVLAPGQIADLIAYRESLRPAQIARDIAELQESQLKLAGDNTNQLYLASLPNPLPDVRRSVRGKAP